MYSRREFGERYPRVPRNYSGNAFRESAPPAATVDLPSEPTKPDEVIEESAVLSEESKQEELSVPSGKLELGRLFGQSGIGSEEIFLLGLILLLSQSEKQDDLLLWLVLLLLIR